MKELTVEETILVSGTGYMAAFAEGAGAGCAVGALVGAEAGGIGAIPGFAIGALVGGIAGVAAYAM